MTTVRTQLGLAKRDLAFLTVGFATSIVAAIVWIAGVSAIASLAVFVIGIPAFIAAAWAFRWAVNLDRRNAARILGRAPRGEYSDLARRGIISRFGVVATDPQTWRDLLWLLLHSVVGFAFGIAAWTLIACVVGYALAPAWIWALPDGSDFGVWHVDTVPESFALVPLAIPLAAITVLAMRGMAIGEARLAGWLLGPVKHPGRLRDWARRPGALVRAHAATAITVGLVCTLIWWLTGHGYFWPGWVWFGLVLAFAIHWVLHHRLTPRHRERQLARRVDTLERTRRGALDVQAEELRRIERDLHDGAQARLVSLSMLIGRAEDQLGDKPEAAELVRQAREEATAAIGELRDLARGIAPPVLADRGLVAAVEAQATRAPMDVTVEGTGVDRLPPVVETAAYFVVSEALTNVAKHAAGSAARVVLRRDGNLLRIEVSDHGPGGADPNGSGLSGLRRRVEAIDGSLRVESDAGGTLIRAELPCA
jgi:signal transduction histidine kinase